MSVLAVQRIYFSYGTSLLARITQKKNIIQLEFRDIFWVGNECFYDFKIVQNQKKKLPNDDMIDHFFPLNIFENRSGKENVPMKLSFDEKALFGLSKLDKRVCL